MTVKWLTESLLIRELWRTEHDDTGDIPGLRHPGPEPAVLDTSQSKMVGCGRCGTVSARSFCSSALHAPSVLSGAGRFIGMDTMSPRSRVPPPRTVRALRYVTA